MFGSLVSNYFEFIIDHIQDGKSYQPGDCYNEHIFCFIIFPGQLYFFFRVEVPKAMP